MSRKVDKIIAVPGDLNYYALSYFPPLNMNVPHQREDIPDVKTIIIKRDIETRLFLNIKLPNGEVWTFR